MKRIVTILAVLLLAACSHKQPAPGTYTYASETGTREITIIHGDCVAFNFYDNGGQPVCSAGPFEKKGRWPQYVYTFKKGSSDFKITARFTKDGRLEAKLYGQIVSGPNTFHAESPTWLPFSANFQQTKNGSN